MATEPNDGAGHPATWREELRASPLRSALILLLLVLGLLGSLSKLAGIREFPRWARALAISPTPAPFTSSAEAVDLDMRSDPRGKSGVILEYTDAEGSHQWASLKPELHAKLADYPHRVVVPTLLTLGRKSSLKKKETKRLAWFAFCNGGPLARALDLDQSLTQFRLVERGRRKLTVKCQ